MVSEFPAESLEPIRWPASVGKIPARGVGFGSAGRAVATGGSSHRQTKSMEKRLTPKFRVAPPAVVEPARAVAAEMDPRAGSCSGCLFIALAPLRGSKAWPALTRRPALFTPAGARVPGSGAVVVTAALSDAIPADVVPSGGASVSAKV